MPININEEDGGKVIALQVSGKLDKADYEQFVPEFARLAQQNGKLRVLFDMNDFHGWNVSAAWEDFKFGVEFFSAIERLAMFGEKKWQHGMAAFCKPFTAAKFRYFDQVDGVEARKWLTAPWFQPGKKKSDTHSSVASKQVPSSAKMIKQVHRFDRAKPLLRFHQPPIYLNLAT